MLLTVVIGLVLYTNRLVIADDQCTQYQFKSLYFYPGSSCEDIRPLQESMQRVVTYQDTI